MSRLPEPPLVHPTRYLAVAENYADRIGDELDRLRTGTGSLRYEFPAIADTLSLAAGEIVKLVAVAADNDARGTNVAPHLLSTLDAMLHELCLLVRTVR